MRPTCILDCDSPSFPASDDERRQCGCKDCLTWLEKWSKPNPPMGDGIDRTVYRDTHCGYGEQPDLAALVRQFFTYLDATEESDSGREFHPVTFSCCRAMWADPLNNVLNEMKRLSALPTDSP